MGSTIGLSTLVNLTRPGSAALQNESTKPAWTSYGSETKAWKSPTGEEADG
jgi:hypothetical protein